MKERPILFSSPMVRAILAGTKTQTRRVVASQPTFDGTFWKLYGAGWSDDVRSVPCVPGHTLSTRNPFGAPGQRLWVRETWAAPHAYDHEPPRFIPRGTRIHYGATEDHGGLRVRPSMFMPRWASRITLEVVGVRVERLQEISEDDARAEGVLTWVGASCAKDNPRELTLREYYELLWDSLNAGRGYTWASNPWVFVVEFRRLTS